jgi:cytochrome P450
MQLIVTALLLGATFIVTYLYYARRPKIALPPGIRLAPSVSPLKLAYDIYVKGCPIPELAEKYQEELKSPIFTFHVPFFGDIGFVSNKDTVKKFYSYSGFFGAVQRIIFPFVADEGYKRFYRTNTLGLAMKNLDKMGPVIAKEASTILNARWKEGKTDLFKEAEYMGFYCLLRAFLGNDVANEEELLHIVHALDLEEIMTHNWSRLYAISPMGRHAQRKDWARLKALFKVIVEKRQEQRTESETESELTYPCKVPISDPKGENFLNVLIDSYLKDKTDADELALAMEEIAYLLYTLLFAGNTNSAFTLSWLLLNLHSNPEVKERLATEIRFAVKNIIGDISRLQTASHKEISMLLNAMPLLDKCLHETLRLVLRSTFSPRNFSVDVVFEEQKIALPKDTLLFFNWFSLNDTPFKEPTIFNPDRPNLKEAMTFGAGLHRCVGEKFAQELVKLIVITVLAEHDLICDKTVDECKPPGYTFAVSRPIQRPKVWLVPVTQEN